MACVGIACICPLKRAVCLDKKSLASLQLGIVLQKDNWLSLFEWQEQEEAEMKKVLISILCAPFVVACGGSGGNDAATPVSVDATPLRILSNGDGAGKLRVEAQGEVATGYILTPELTLVLQELEATGEVVPFDFQTLPLVGSAPNTQIRQGAITVDGVTLNALAAVTEADDAALVLFEDPTLGISLLSTQGSEATGVPLSGTATYSGLFGMQDVYFDPAPELGTFTATTNFQTSTVGFDGSTASYRASGTASISGNSFSSGAMVIEDQPFAIVESGTLHGDFHGSGGNSMAGIIYSNDSDATYRGGFIGSR